MLGRQALVFGFPFFLQSNQGGRRSSWGGSLCFSFFFTIQPGRSECLGGFFPVFCLHSNQGELSVTIAMSTLSHEGSNVISNDEDSSNSVSIGTCESTNIRSTCDSTNGRQATYCSTAASKPIPAIVTRTVQHIPLRGKEKVHTQFAGASNTRHVDQARPRKQVAPQQLPKKPVEHYILNEWGTTSSERAELRSLHDTDDDEEEDM